MNRRESTRRVGLVQPTTTHENCTAQGCATLEVPANLRTQIVNRAEPRAGIQRHTRPITVLVHASDTGVLHDEFLGHAIVPQHEFDQEVATFAATGAARNSIGSVLHQ